MTGNHPAIPDSSRLDRIRAEQTRAGAYIRAAQAGLNDGSQLRGHAGRERLGDGGGTCG